MYTCLLLLLALCARLALGDYERAPKLIVVLIEGMPNTYLIEHAELLTGFDDLAAKGAKAHYLLPQFATETAPNFYALFSDSIGTPVYSDYLLNDDTVTTVYDRSNRHFNSTFAQKYNWLWQQAADQGKQVSLYNWKLCPPKDPLTGETPSNVICYPYSLCQSPIANECKIKPYLDYVSDIISSGQTHLHMINFDLAAILENHPLHSEGAKNALLSINSHLNSLMSILEQQDYWLDTELIVMSDRGVAQSSHEKYAFLDDYNDLMTNVEHVALGRGYALLHPVKSGEHKVLQTLRSRPPLNCAVHAYSDWPSRWQTIKDAMKDTTTDNARPILILCQVGAGVTCRQSCKEYPSVGKAGAGGLTGDWFQAAHGGYDNAAPVSKGFLVARGRSFAEGAHAEYLAVSSVYSILCGRLKINCSIKPDADAKRRIGTLVSGSISRQASVCLTISLVLFTNR